MYEHEKITPYKEGSKKSQVEAMFNNIAPTYDKLNHRLSWSIDRLWRRKAIAMLRPAAPKIMLDIATGTADFAIQAAETLKPEQLIATDISDGMMEIGRQKVEKKGLGSVVSFAKEDSTGLSFDDNRFDAVTVAFGIRNFDKLDQGLSEMCRVLKKGGKLCILELSTPVRWPMKQLFSIYAHTILPLYGRLVSRDDAAYSYLIKTIEAFPQGETMKGILANAGFTGVEFKRLTFGICTLYLATK